MKKWYIIIIIAGCCCATSAQSVQNSMKLVSSPRLYDAVVAVDGTGNYRSVQDAIDAAPANRHVPWLIFIKTGNYKGTVNIPRDKPLIHLIGQDRDKTVIHEKLHVGAQPQEGSPWYSNDTAAWKFSTHNPQSPVYRTQGSVVIVSASDFYAENITFQNDYGVEAQTGPQALALRTQNDRSTFYNCNFRSFQDTWQTSSAGINDRIYAYKCLIEGAVDYFYGGGNAYIEECTFYNLRTGSVIVAPNHREGTQWGYVFHNCIVDGNAASNDGQQKLGRPWRNEPIAVFLNTTMKIQIHPEGWTDMGSAAKLFAEYNSMDVNGKPLDLSQRRTWYRQRENQGGQVITGLKAVLTAEEAAQYTYENVVSGADGWNPRSHFGRVTKPTNLVLTNHTLSWNASENAICYIVIKDEQVIGFTVDTKYVIASVDKTAKYALYAVGESGSLSVLSNTVMSSK